jgi:acyl-CoA thioester hydrolase
MRSASRVRVRYAETDQMGVVYYANYFVWFEVGRTDLLRSLGGSYRELEAEGIFLPVIEATCEYAQSGRYDDELEIRTDGRVLSPIRVEFTYEVVRLADGDTLARGRTMHAAINRAGRPCRLPAPVRQALAAPADTGPLASAPDAATVHSERS